MSSSANTRKQSTIKNLGKKDYVRQVVVTPPQLVSGLQIKAETNNAFLIINFLDTVNNVEENSLVGSFLLPNKMVRDIHKNLTKYLEELGNINDE